MAEEKSDKDQSTEKLRDQAETLLSQARMQLADIQRALGAMVGDTALQSRLTALAAQISGAISALSQALHSPGSALRQVDLATLESIVHSTETTTLLTEAFAQAMGGATLAEAVVTASAATRLEAQTLATDLFDRHLFDAYLHFDSAEDEAEFRKREAARQRLIAGDLARHTPEGNLNAAIREAGQMVDAGTHGASASPDFQPRWQHLVETIRRQREAMRAKGMSTEEADRLLRDALRHSLHGVPPAEVERILASPEPLQAMTSYFHGHRGRDLDVSPQSTDRSAASVQPATPPAPIRAAVAAAAITLQAGMDMSAAGLSMDGSPPASEAGHGLPDQAGTPTARNAPGRP